MLGSVVDGLSDLGFWRTILFVVAPMMFLAGIGLLTIGVWRFSRRLDELAEHDELAARVTEEVTARLSRYVMFDHIHFVISNGWRVTSESDGIRFEAPDNAGAVTVGFDELNWYYIARRLHEAAPLHFPEDWLPPVVSTATLAARTAHEASVKLSSLENRVKALEERSRPSSGALANLLVTKASRLHAEQSAKDTRPGTP